MTYVMTQCRARRRAQAFTLVELLVVLAIIGVLVAILLPAVKMVRESARRTQCENNLRQIALAATQHHDVHRHFPTGGWGWQWIGEPERGFSRAQPGGWIFNVLPYMEQGHVRDLTGAGAAPQDRAARQLQMMATPPRRRAGGCAAIGFQPVRLLLRVWAVRCSLS